VGRIEVFGMDVTKQTNDVRRRIGFMPDHFSMYRQMTVQEYLDFFAAAYGIPYSERMKVVEDVMTLTDMEGRRDSLIQTLSRGMQQRVGLARVLVNDPDLLLLDEPASGLDPRVRIEIRNLLKRLGELNKTIIVSSHILPELADVCNKVGMIEKGILFVNGKVNEVMQQVRKAIILNIKVAKDQPKAAKLLEKMSTVDKVTENKEGVLLVTLKSGVLDYSEIPTALIQEGFKLLLFREEELNLETAFMELTKGLVQ